jgi:hypothetical protein
MEGMRHICTTPAAAALLLAANVGLATPNDAITVLQTAPFDVPVGPLSQPPSAGEVVAFGGQPRIDNAGNWYGSYIFPVSNPNDPFEFTRDAAYFRNGDVFNREGYYLPNTSDFVIVADLAVSQRPYFDVSIANDGTIAQVIKGTFGVPAIADGTPDATAFDFESTEFPRVDAAVVDNTVIFSEGDVISPISEFFGMSPSADASVIPLFEISSVRAVSADEVIVFATFSTNSNTFAPEFRAIFRVTDPGQPTQVNELLATSEPGNPLPGLPGVELSTYGAGEDGIDHNAEGDVLFTGDVRGEPFDEDDALILYDSDTGSFQPLIRAGDPSPVPGADYFGLLFNPVALNDEGDWAIRADTTADFSTDQLIVVNGQAVIREDDTVGTRAPGPLQLDSAIANVELDREGNVIWYGAWAVDDLCTGLTDNGSDFGIFEGLFFNDEVLLEAGVTSIHDVEINGVVFPELVLKDLPNTQFGGFYVSPDGDRLIVEALFAEPSVEVCDFSINVSVPVGAVLLEVDLERVRNPDAVEPCGDITGDGFVDGSDLVALLAAFGQETGDGAAGGDFDDSGTVDGADLVTLLATFGQACP